jgi:hypothetical protein
MMRLHSLERHHKDSLAGNVDLLALDLNRSLRNSPGPENMPHASPRVRGVLAVVGLSVFAHLEAGDRALDFYIDERFRVKLGLDVEAVELFRKNDAEVVGDEAVKLLIEGVVVQGRGRPMSSSIGKEDLDVELGADMKVSTPPPSASSGLSSSQAGEPTRRSNR